jgi:hypothetical protein
MKKKEKLDGSQSPSWALDQHRASLYDVGRP